MECKAERQHSCIWPQRHQNAVTVRETKLYNKSRALQVGTKLFKHWPWMSELAQTCWLPRVFSSHFKSLQLAVETSRLGTTSSPQQRTATEMLAVA